ncbi:MAG TPA: nucleotidyl transferase AbiEii/AbiGii toxin family protein [Candidatus Nanopelagicaceae bacterium]|jgi:predicted nucleotidyltransferase component of viral defense system
MLDLDESQDVQELFGAEESQVNRDHAISHVLVALQQINTEFVFFGGTALSRTYLTTGRLSEDIDLYSPDRRALCRELDDLPRLMKEEFPQAVWNVIPSQTVEPRSSLLVCEASIQIRVQVVDALSRGWQSIPTNLVDIHQRYSDVSKTQLIVPTFDGFVAMKILAWFDRGAPRDLFDLDGLSRIGAVSSATHDLVEKLRGYRLTKQMLSRKVSGLWQEELAHQTKLERSENECLARVLEWWGKSES